MAATGIHHVALSVTDWNRSRSFYLKLAEALGASPIIDATGPPHREADGRVLVFAGDGFMFSIWEAAREFRDKRFALYDVGLHHYAFAVASRADVDRLHAVLRGLGAEILEPPREYDYVPGYYAVFFTGPDGIKLEYAFVPGSR